MILSASTKTEIVEDLRRRFSPVQDQADYDDALSIEQTIKNDCSELLNRFFQSRSDANVYLSASQQEEVEKDFKEWVLKL